jgi:hypothetical protein
MPSAARTLAARSRRLSEVFLTRVLTLETNLGKNSVPARCGSWNVNLELSSFSSVRFCSGRHKLNLQNFVDRLAFPDERVAVKDTFIASVYPIETFIFIIIL